MSSSFLQNIITHGSKYFTGSIVSAGVALIMTKYYTFVFNPADFGVLALYLVMFQYVISLASLTLDSGSTRFYFDYRKTKRDEYLSTMFWFITAIAIVVLILGVVFMKPVSNWISPNSEVIYLTTLVTGIGAVYVSYLTRILYNEHKSTSVLKHTIFQTFINHASSVLFISVFHMGIFGRMSGQGLGYILNIFTLIREFSKENLFKIKMTFNKAMAKETFILSLPGMMSVLLGVAFIYLDRFFLKHYIGDSAVGIYTLGYMLGKGLSMVYEAISQAILPKVFSDMNENYERARDELEYFSYRYYIGLAIITIIISALSPVIVVLFSNDDYSEAATVMPFVMAGFMMGGFYKIPALVLGYHKIVWFYPFLAIFAFGTNALLNWLLIPIYGMLGSAFASFVGLFLYSTVLQIFSFKYFSKMYSITMIFMYIILFIIIFILFQIGDF
ncbi:oligosaccharide flippase family protein [Aliarcobacter cryaerophilus]|uniref:oligosaccharide flippase family protein n=1 Tax=Aliarcobacter cryaerophilus TaxID=28198 RepID=UPI003DA5E021